MGIHKMIFKDRNDAGRQLAQKLLHYRDKNPLILALPRGGAVVGYEIAKMLKAPLDVFVTRKIGAPFQPEFGIGAVAPNNIRILDEDTVSRLKISPDELERIIERETVELNRRIKLYRKNLPPLDLKERIIILADDGLATGVTAMAAVMAIRLMSPEKLVLAVPVSPLQTANRFRHEVDEFVCLQEPADFYAVSAFYENFEQITDDEVISLLHSADR